MQTLDLPDGRHCSILAVASHLSKRRICFQFYEGAEERGIYTTTAASAASSSSKMAELIVVRHGETTWNATGRLQGQLESDLNEAGNKQALAVAERLAKQDSKITAVYSSDLRRAAETAQAIADRCGILEVHLKSSLRERHLGRLQGLTRSEARRVEPKAYEAFTSPRDEEPIPGGGESLDQLYERTKAAIEEIAQQHQGETVVVVTHGGVLRALHIHAKGLPASGRVPNASINVFTISNDNEWRLRTWGDVRHLKGVGFLSSGFGGDKESG